MSNTGGDLKEQKPKGVFSTLFSNGDWLYRRGEYKKALDSFTKALALKPDDQSCFVGRSKCYLKMGQYVDALKDAEASLQGDKSFHKGLYQKAEALYYMGEFEFALGFYHQGQRLRPLIKEFELGIQKAQDAILNAIGSPSSVTLEVKGDLSFLKEQEEITEPMAIVQNLMEEKKEQPAQKTPKSKKINKQLLEEFYQEKKFLEDLMKDEDLVKTTTKGGEQLQDMIQSRLTSLDTYAKFCALLKPICPQEGKSKLAQQKGSKPRHNAPPEPAEFLLKSLDEIDGELTSGNAKGSLKKAEEVMKIVQRWSQKEVPHKKEVLGNLHSSTGNALIKLGDLDKALEHHQKDLELAKQCKLPEAKSRALENIGRVYAQTGQFARAIEVWEKKIPLVQGGVEKTWLFHEIGRCYLELNRHEDARDYGVRSVAAADEIADEKWRMIAHVLAAQSEWKLGNFDSCVSHFERAFTHAKLQEDDSKMNAIQKALDEAKRHLPQ